MIWFIDELIDDSIDAPWKVPGNEKDMQAESNRHQQQSTSAAKSRDMRVQCHRSNLPVSRPEIENSMAPKAWRKKMYHTLTHFISVHKSKTGSSQCVPSHETGSFIACVCWCMVFLPRPLPRPKPRLWQTAWPFPSAHHWSWRPPEATSSIEITVQLQSKTWGNIPRMPICPQPSLFTLVHFVNFPCFLVLLDGLWWCLVPVWPGSGCWSSPNLCPPSEGWTPPTDHQRAAPHHTGHGYPWPDPWPSDGGCGVPPEEETPPEAQRRTTNKFSRSTCHTNFTETVAVGCCGWLSVTCVGKMCGSHASLQVVKSWLTSMVSMVRVINACKTAWFDISWDGERPANAQRLASPKSVEPSGNDACPLVELHVLHCFEHS